MKHKITFSVIAAAALASCTQNEDFTSQYNEKAKTMKFDVAYVGKNTRAATGDLTTENLGSQKLILWCDAYQTPAPQTTPSTGIWISTQEPLYLSKSASDYWNVYKAATTTESDATDVNYPGSTYTTYFTAIAPQDEFEAAPTGEGPATKATYSMAGQLSSENQSSSPSFSNRKLTLDKIPVVQQVVNGDSPQGIDYLIACTNSTSEEVSLPFKHLLSRLRFAVWTDENTMATTGSETTKIELNYLKVYLPKDKTAKYVQTKHDDVAGTWSWNDYTAPTEENPTTLDDYKVYTLYDEGTGSVTPKDIKYFEGPTTAHLANNWDNVKLIPNFFIAPNGSTNAKIYIDIKYTVRRKIGSDWSTTNEQSTGEGVVYSAGHKVVERNKMLVPVGDSNYGHGNETEADPENRNEGLSHFHQGTLETLYICLRADQKVAFSTEFNVNGWQVDNWEDDPIDINQ